MTLYHWKVTESEVTETEVIFQSSLEDLEALIKNYCDSLHDGLKDSGSDIAIAGAHCYHSTGQSCHTCHLEMAKSILSITKYQAIKHEVLSYQILSKLLK